MQSEWKPWGRRFWTVATVAYAIKVGVEWWWNFHVPSWVELLFVVVFIFGSWFGSEKRWSDATSIRETEPTARKR